MISLILAVYFAAVIIIITFTILKQGIKLIRDFYRDGSLATHIKENIS